MMTIKVIPLTEGKIELAITIHGQDVIDWLELIVALDRIERLGGNVATYIDCDKKKVKLHLQIDKSPHAKPEKSNGQAVKPPTSAENN